MDRILVVQPEKCTSCRTCELTCSFTKTGEMNPELARISVLTYEKVGLAVPMICQQCGVPACMLICPVGAITKNTATGAMEVHDSKCIGCKMCTIACPFGAIHYHVATNIVSKCDLCFGDPACVKLCPSGAISFVEANAGSIAKRKTFAAKFKNLFEEVG
ncbi:MAG TPA: 4Fe-4S dicluster domain-containing protein [Syntrophomonadaceae bacterium]|nr:4Fe-4S dicluster domain-containing protein [Syntrophomonadaceae bacterium]